jgi:hypothetical protein
MSLFKKVACFTDIHFGLKSNSTTHLRDCEEFVDWFIAEAHILQGKAKRDAVDNPMRLFHFSITYLTVLFIAVGIDPLIFIKVI